MRLRWRPVGAELAGGAYTHVGINFVRVLEQATFPRFVIGESLLPHCMDILDAAGLLARQAPSPSPPGGPRSAPCVKPPPQKSDTPVPCSL